MSFFEILGSSGSVLNNSIHTFGWCVFCVLGQVTIWSELKSRGRLLAIEQAVANFCFKGGLLGHGKLKLILFKTVQRAGLGGGYGGVSRLAVQERHFAEEVTLGENSQLFSCAIDPNFTVADQIELVSHVTFSDDHLSCSEVLWPKVIDHFCEASGSQVFEDFALGQHLADEGGFLDEDIASYVSIDQVDDTICHVQDSVVVSDDDDGGLVFASALLEQLHHSSTTAFVQGGGGLVGQYQFGSVHQAAGNGHSLFLTTGKLFRFMVDSLTQSNGLQHLLAPQGLSFARAVRFYQFEGHANILGGGKRVEKVVSLKDESDFPPQI